MRTFWEKYKFEGQPIPINQWGQDHWSTFAYLETLVVDGDGVIDNRRMRCNPRLHRELANMGGFERTVIDGSKYPTRLKDGATKEKHDDWSCLEDMVAQGLIDAFWRLKHPDEVFGNTEAKIKFTPQGMKIAHQLREFKAQGGRCQDFEPSL